MGVFTKDSAKRPPRRPRRVHDGSTPLSATSFASSTLPDRGVGRQPRVPTSNGSLPYSTHRSLTAAARSIPLDNADEVERLSKRRVGDEWQQEAWEYYDAIGEIKFALSMVASVASRVRLHVAWVEDPSQSPSPVDPKDSRNALAATTALARLDSAYGGQPGLIRDAILNIQVAGECYLVQHPGSPVLGIKESWDIRSVDELTVDGSKNVVVKLRRDSSPRDPKSTVRLPKNAFVARIWRPHPRFSDEGDSSMRGILDLCAELLLLNRTFRATARSRLNAGAMYLPDGLSVSASADPEYVESEDGLDPISSAAVEESGTDDADEFEDALMEAMTTPITDEESAAAVVPLLIRGPSELGEKIRLLKFERAFDPALATRSDRVLDRIMQGIDVPKDVVTGLANVKYSNAVQINESLYKAHIEPLILLLCDALTVVYLRPALKAAGVTEHEQQKYVVWFDPTEVTTRPDRAEDADAGFDRYTVSMETWRRSHGFNEKDAPSPEEVAIRLLAEKGSITPEFTEAILTAIAPDLMKKIRDASQATSPAPLPPGVNEILQGGQPSDTVAPEPVTDTPPGQPNPTPGAAPPPATTPQPVAPPSAPLPSPAPSTGPVGVDQVAST